MKQAFRSVVVISVFTLSTQVVLFAVQLFAAAKFGAGSDMDAFLAASTLPQFVITVLLGSLGFVFIPMFIDFQAQGDSDKASKLAIGLFNSSILLLTVVSVLGIIFARQILEITTPGLTESTLEQSVRIAVITWPTIIGTGAYTLLASMYQAEKRFGWQAIAPFIGSLINLGILLLLTPYMGIMGLAIAASASAGIQALLLIGILSEKGRYRFKLYWNEAGVTQAFRVVAPLIFVAIVTKFTPLIDRYLASGLTEGSISHLSYAFKGASLISLLISTGIATVIFPKMAGDVARNDMAGLRNTLSFGIRTMWIIIAPVVAIGTAVSLPMVLVLFNRGEFTMEDSVIVSSLLQIYLVALAGICLGTVTGKVFYALRKTKTLAFFGLIEAICYCIYTVYLAWRFGAVGIAVGYVIYFSLSLLWQVVLLRLKLGGESDRGVVRSFAVTLLASIAAGATAYFIVLKTTSIVGQLLLGGFAGLVVYVLGLYLMDSSELMLLRDTMMSAFRKNRENG